MARSRLLLTILGIALSLGMLLWLVNTLLNLYTGLSLLSPLLARWVVAIVLALAIALLIALAYYAYLFLRPQQRRARPKISSDPTEAVVDALQSAQMQVDQIQDEVTRQALQDRARQIEADLARGELQVAIFGTGSAGKTSLANAIVGRMVGQVGAAMGTTQAGQTYRFHLKHLEREIWITDTPGILEMGVAGTERERLARQLAAEADLLLFVIDNDLRQSEYVPLRSLSAIGKRLILVFNKSDLYAPADLEAILSRVRSRVQGPIAAEDLVAIAASPQSVRLESGELVRPEPEILPLLRRMAAILREEGEALIADNILLRSQQLGEEARQILDNQRQRQAEQVVDRFQWVGAGVVAMMPLPFVDLLAAAAINAQMVVEIGRVYDCEMSLEQGKELALSLAKTLVSLGVVRGAVEIFSLALQTNVATFLIGRAIQGATAAYLTRIAGRSFIQYFRRNQNWGDGGMSEVIQEQFQLDRREEFIKAFVQQAVARVVEPLTKNQR